MSGDETRKRGRPRKIPGQSEQVNVQFDKLTLQSIAVRLKAGETIQDGIRDAVAKWIKRVKPHGRSSKP